MIISEIDAIVQSYAKLMCSRFFAKERIARLRVTCNFMILCELHVNDLICAFEQQQWQLGDFLFFRLEIAPLLYNEFTR